MKKLVVFISILVMLMLGGCSVNKATGSRTPEFESNNINKLYVAHQPKDDRFINKLIKTQLEKRGFEVDTGNLDDAPDGVDGVVTYVDKWMWDITTYMIELSIFIRDPDTEFPIAQGYSMHTSLTRKSPEEMVEEVVGNMLGEGEIEDNKNAEN